MAPARQNRKSEQDRKATANRAAALAACLILAAGCSASSTSRQDLVDEPTPPVDAPRISVDNIPADEVRATDIINRSKDHVERTGEIYLMRGLANVFSRGIDHMARTLRQRGYDASNFSYAQWRDIAPDIIRRSLSKDVSFPVIIIGHSLGGNESSKFANALAENGVPVALVVAFDPVETGKVGPKIDRVVNYYLPKSEDNRIFPTDGFTGTIKNIDVTVDPEITHTNVEKNTNFQNETYRTIERLTEKLRKRPNYVVDR